MNLSRVKHTLETVTNVAVLVAGLVTIIFFARAYFLSNAKRSLVKLPAGMVLPEIENLKYSDATKTLVLALSTGCKYCEISAPFYRTLAAKQHSFSEQPRIVAIFPEDEESVESFVRNHQLEIDFRPSIDLSALHVSSTPTLILIDSRGNIIDSWIGSLSKEGQEDVLKALSNVSSESGHKAATTARVGTAIAQTVSLFNENSPLLTITPDNPHKDERPPNVNFFDVDQLGNVFLATDGGIVKYNNRGERIAQTVPPNGFRGVFCVDADGNTYLPSGTSLLRYDAALKENKQIPIAAVLKKETIVLKMETDGSNNAIYIQTYEPKSLNQVLYKFDLTKLRADSIFTLERPVRFSPTFTVGAFDFALGSKYVYVSDIYEYRIHLYSLVSGAYVKTFSRQFSASQISESDGELKNRRMRIGGLTDSPNALKNYPPILHLNVADNGLLVVWTSRRNAEHKQVVDVYDQDFKVIGTDLKYAHPTINNHLFRNGNVYIPDFGFGRNVAAPNLSPLEVPSLPLSLKIFRFDLTNTKPV